MKTKLISITAACLIASMVAAQSPAPQPSASPNATAASQSPAQNPQVNLPPKTLASFVSAQLLSATLQALNQNLQAIDSGAAGATAKDVQESYGPEMVTRIRTAQAIVSGTSPAPSPSAPPDQKQK